MEAIWRPEPITSRLETPEPLDAVMISISSLGLVTRMSWSWIRQAILRTSLGWPLDGDFCETSLQHHCETVFFFFFLMSPTYRARLSGRQAAVSEGRLRIRSWHKTA